MKSIHGYIILFISFFGIIILQNYVDNKHGIVFQGGKILKSINQRIKLENKINRLEFTIDSLNIAMTEKLDEKIINKNPSNYLIPENQSNYVPEYYFGSLDEAVKIRNDRGERSYIAQQYINLAYEMGGNDWYGAEKIWNTENFNNRLSLIKLDN